MGLNIGKKTREIELTIKIEVNAELDKKELAFIVKKIKGGIKVQECVCGFRFLKISKIPFQEFEMEVGLGYITCKGDKCKAFDDAINKKEVKK